MTHIPCLKTMSEFEQSSMYFSLHHIVEVKNIPKFLYGCFGFPFRIRKLTYKVTNPRR